MEQTDSQYAIEKAQEIDPDGKIMRPISKYGWFIVFPGTGSPTVVAYFDVKQNNDGAFSFKRIFDTMIHNFSEIKSGNLTTEQFWRLV